MVQTLRSLCISKLPTNAVVEVDHNNIIGFFKYVFSLEGIGVALLDFLKSNLSKQVLFEADEDQKLHKTPFEALTPEEYALFCNRVLEKVQKMWEVHFPKGSGFLKDADADTCGFATLSHPKMEEYVNSLSQDDLATCFIATAEHGHLRLFEIILKSQRTDIINKCCLDKAFDAACKNGHPDIFNAIINSGKFDDICNGSLCSDIINKCCSDKAFDAYWTNGHPDIFNAIINSGKFDDICDGSLCLAFCGACMNGDIDIANTIINLKRFKDINDMMLGVSFIWVCTNGHPDIANAIINSGRFDDISNGSLSTAFSGACKNGHPDIANAIINSGRFDDN